ncbi:MAG: purine-nucleoside phosphorylase [Candidatus Kapabacteria bacterium]|nr:purine-nucleoside phosphorylase [Candidatus Kapabacteria bacterium]
MASELRTHIDESLAYIRSLTQATPRVGIILGTGLSHLANEVTQQTVIPYNDIPHMPHSTVESHAGRLMFGTLGGTDVVVMQGRFHYYEGYTMRQITHGVRVMKALGVDTLIVSNACGALNPLYCRSDIMLITDHINLLGDNPLIGANDDSLGPRFPDMSDPYTQSLQTVAEQSALELGLKMQQGVYVAVAGPNLETRAEYRFLRTIGADVVGMSTIPEVIVAVHSSMRVLGFSVITDECFPDALKPVSLPEILEAAAVAEPKLTAIIKRVLEKI